MEHFKKIELQPLLFGGIPEADQTRDMYYRSTTAVCCMEEDGFYLRKGFYDFSTYFNSLSAEKWLLYTIVDTFSLEMSATGKFEIDLMGHYVGSDHQIHKEWFGNYFFDLKEKQTISIPFPAEMRSTVLSFQISVVRNTIIYGGGYSAWVNEKEMKKPHIMLVTTTYKKEDYIRRNCDLLKKSVFADPVLRNGFEWKIIDNGSTLPPSDDEHIKIIPNPNVGGSGGFCRGMIEAASGNQQPSHVLLMDDDVQFQPESFRRLYTLLSLLMDEYRSYFISGAMLEINAPNVQHEDIGEIRENGEHGPSKPRFDLNLWDSIILNEQIQAEDNHHYSGWWFCCIPVETVRLDNLPMPFFIRGDDVEYSIRNHAKFITMNGICIWHEGFGTKFSSSLELYQVHRNDLILQALNEEVSDVKIIERIQELFWQELFKFNYRGCSLLLDAVEDFLKGPEFLETLDGEKNMKEKKAEDNEMQPITPELRNKIDYVILYQWSPLHGIKGWLYNHTCNGQKRLRHINSKKKVGIIPYGWGYFQAKMTLVDTIYAIDPLNDIYTVYHKDVSKFKELSRRYRILMKKYETEKEQVSASYRAGGEKMQGIEFWTNYLKIKG